jgi:nucleoside 2-deoxyribosyltransferase
MGEMARNTSAELNETQKVSIKECDILLAILTFVRFHVKEAIAA